MTIELSWQQYRHQQKHGWKIFNPKRMTQAGLNQQFRELNRVGLGRKKLIIELKTYWTKCNWHTVQKYFDGCRKMKDEKRLMIEAAINDIIKKYS